MVALTLKVYTTLSTAIVFLSWVTSDDNTTVGLAISLFIFGGNLYWITKSVDSFLESCKGGQTGSVFGFISSFRILFFLLAIFGILLAFGWVPVLIGNSLVVCTLLGSALTFEHLDRKDNIDE